MVHRFLYKKNNNYINSLDYICGKSRLENGRNYFKNFAKLSVTQENKLLHDKLVVLMLSKQETIHYLKRIIINV